MKYFLLFFGILTGILFTGLVGGIYYLSQKPTDAEELNEITFEKIDTTFGNGQPGGTLWDTTNPGSEKVILAKLENVRTFLALAEWLRLTPVPEPDLPMYFALPENATTVKTFIAQQDGIPYTGAENTLIGVLLEPNRVALKFGVDNTITGDYFTGHDVRPTLQVLAMIIVYTVS